LQPVSTYFYPSAAGAYVRLSFAETLSGGHLHEALCAEWRPGCRVVGLHSSIRAYSTPIVRRCPPVFDPRTGSVQRGRPPTAASGSTILCGRSARGGWRELRLRELHARLPSTREAIRLSVDEMRRRVGCAYQTPDLQIDRGAVLVANSYKRLPLVAGSALPCPDTPALLRR